MAIPLLDKLVSAFGGSYADANRVDIDRTELTNVQGDTVQDVTTELERLYNETDKSQIEIVNLHHRIETHTLSDLQEYISPTHTTGSAWTVPTNATQVRATVTRLYAAFWDENRLGPSPFRGNYFEDLTDPNFAISNIYYFADANDVVNTFLPGIQTYYTGDLNIDGGPLVNSFKKMIGLTYHITNINLSSNLTLLRAGTRDILQVNQNGILVVVGNQDGLSASVTISERLNGEDNGRDLQYLIGLAADNTEWSITDDLNFPLALTLRLKSIDDGVSQPVTSATYTITDRDTDQAQTTQTISMNLVGGGTRDETFRFSYDSTNHILNVGTPGFSLNGPNEITHVSVEVTHSVTSSVNNSNTSSSNTFYNQNDINQVVDVLLIIEPENPFETSADKRLAVKAIVEGRQIASVPLNYRESNYDFSDFQIGPAAGDDLAIGRLQIYSWDESSEPGYIPTLDEMYHMWLRRHEWLGLFRPPDEDVTTFVLDTNLELTSGHGIIRVSPDGSRYVDSVDDTGTISTTEL